MPETFVCPHCGKEYKTQRGFDNHKCPKAPDKVPDTKPDRKPAKPAVTVSKDKTKPTRPKKDEVEKKESDEGKKVEQEVGDKDEQEVGDKDEQEVGDKDEQEVGDKGKSEVEKKGKAISDAMPIPVAEEVEQKRDDPALALGKEDEDGVDHGGDAYVAGMGINVLLLIMLLLPLDYLIQKHLVAGDYQGILYPLQVVETHLVAWIQTLMGIEVNIVDATSLRYTDPAVHHILFDVSPVCTGFREIIFISILVLLTRIVPLERRMRAVGFLAAFVIIENLIRIIVLQPITIVYGEPTMRRFHYEWFFFGQLVFLMVVYGVWAVLALQRVERDRVEWVARPGKAISDAKSGEGEVENGSRKALETEEGYIRIEDSIEKRYGNSLLARIIWFLVSDMTVGHARILYLAIIITMFTATEIVVSSNWTIGPVVLVSIYLLVVAILTILVLLDSFRRFMDDGTAGRLRMVLTRLLPIGLTIAGDVILEGHLSPNGKADDRR